MTLAAILFLSLTFSQIVGRSPLFYASESEQSAATQDNSAPPPAQTNPAPSQNSTGTTNPKSSTPQGKSGAAKPSTPVRHKQSPKAKCTPAPAATNTQTPPNSQSNTQGAAPGTGSAPGADTAKNSPQAPATASTNCPPHKVVIRQGGTTETIVQLVGGGAPPAQASMSGRTRLKCFNRQKPI